MGVDTAQCSFKCIVKSRTTYTRFGTTYAMFSSGTEVAPVEGEFSRTHCGRSLREAGSLQGARRDHGAWQKFYTRHTCTLHIIVSFPPFYRSTIVFFIMVFTIFEIYMFF